MTDKELIRKVHKGNKETLNAIVSRYYDEIYRFCVYLTGQETDSYDITQEVFLRFIKYVDSIRAMFRSADALLPIDEKTKSSTIGKLRGEIAAKEVLPIRSRTAIWLNRMRYADRSIYGFHLFGCIVMLLMIIVMDVQRVDNEMMIAYSMILAGVLGSLSVFQVWKICFANLAELSKTCFFDVRQMAAIDMIISGIINLTVLAFGIVFVGCRWKIWLLQIGLYILVPFVFAQCICMGVLLTETGRRNSWMTAAAAIFISVFYAMLASTPRLYTQSALLIWGIALVIGGVIFAVQVRRLFTEIGKGEILCTNWN